MFSEAAVFSESHGSRHDCQLCAYSRLEKGAYARDEMDIQANAPSPLLSKRSVQKGGGGAYFREFTVYTCMLRVDFKSLTSL